MTRRMMRVPTASPPLVTGIVLHIPKIWSPGRQIWGSLPGGKWPVGSGSYCDGWRGAASILFCSCKRTQHCGGSGCHPGSQGRQGAGPKLYTEQGSEALSGSIPSHHDIQRGPSHAVLPTVWKLVHMLSIPKLGKDPARPPSYYPLSLLDTIGKLFEKILLSRILSEIRARRLLCDEQFGFRRKHGTYFQLARLIERVTRREKANRRGFSWRGLGLRFCLRRWSPLQANGPSRPLLPSKNHNLLPA
jgi:hypothetical protein